jgi:hypothetical protein
MSVSKLDMIDYVRHIVLWVKWGSWMDWVSCSTLVTLVLLIFVAPERVSTSGARWLNVSTGLDHGQAPLDVRHDPSRPRDPF